jgi:hypothetical protein
MRPIAEGRDGGGKGPGMVQGARSNETTDAAEPLHTAAPLGSNHASHDLYNSRETEK